mgnify:CR=1 FL=1
MATVALVLCTTASQAQVSAYTALPPVKLTTGASDTPYDAITGGTILVDGTNGSGNIATGYTTWDVTLPTVGPMSFGGYAAFVGNGAEIGTGQQVRTGPGLPIGFTFTYNSLPFDRIGISSQGWISFGNSSPNPSTAVQVYTATTNTNNTLPLFNTTLINNDARRNRVVAWGQYGGLPGDGNKVLFPYVYKGEASQPGSRLRMETIGTAPNRVCVVQWENYSFMNCGFNATCITPGVHGSSQGPGIANFQIRLYETTNQVEIRYGRVVNGAGSPMQFGLGGAVGGDGGDAAGVDGLRVRGRAAEIGRAHV